VTSDEDVRYAEEATPAPGVRSGSSAGPPRPLQAPIAFPESPARRAAMSSQLEVIMQMQQSVIQTTERNLVRKKLVQVGAQTPPKGYLRSTLPHNLTFLKSLPVLFISRAIMTVSTISIGYTTESYDFWRNVTYR
jgi:hypothetical protein